MFTTSSSQHISCIGMGRILSTFGEMSREGVEWGRREGGRKGGKMRVGGEGEEASGRGGRGD